MAAEAAPSEAPNLLDQLRANPRLPLMVGAALAVAAIAALWLWSRQPDYRVLYGNLADRDGGAIIASLQQMNVPYRFADGGGAVMVPAEKVAELRLRLASQGLPKGGTVGFELMDNQKFGTSQFAEQINYQRALEGELARSINSISAVESARVHLALPKASLFVRDQKKPTASVVLTLHRGRVIDDGQVNAVVHLVSSSVPELSAKSISVVDQNGNLLSSPGAAARGLDGSQLKYTQEIEQAYARRIEAILQPIIGSGNVHAQVAADIDFSVVEATDEKYRPNQEPGSAAVRSQQSSDASQQNGPQSGGVPGALSNQPPVNPVAPIALPAASQARVAGQLQMSTELSGFGRGNGSTRRDATVNYEVDRSIRHTQLASGGVRRVSVAVVVNNRETTNAQGKRVTQALSAAELEQVRNLVKQAMGFSAERGDSLNVVNSAFAGDGNGPELPLWRQPDNIELAKTLAKYLLFAALGLYLWLAVLRPLLRRHLQPVPAAGDAGASTAAAASAAQQEPEDAELAAKRSNARHEENMQYARSVAEKEPLMVAMLIKNWMAKDGK